MTLMDVIPDIWAYAESLKPAGLKYGIEPFVSYSIFPRMENCRTDTLKNERACSS